MAKAPKVSTASIMQLIELVGGKENIASVTHCLTRLRFALADPKIANVDAIEELPFVKGCFNNAG
nr:PTS transporter subunit EIIB [Gilliamella apicola]